MNPLILKYQSSIRKICRSLAVKELYIFGSGADDTIRKDSDLDFLVSFKNGLSAEIYADNYFKLHQALEDLFNREIDLLTDRQLSNPFLIESINSSKQLVYEETDKKNICLI
ncbi:MAG: nucleotidyltransferase domain-containing protein [Balneolaceae bacterium]|nr:nucleotidyltransferase domain-containing protein [Balneolaceae bacterium]